MARQTRSDRQRKDTALAVIQAEADQLAEDSGADPGRVRANLERLVISFTPLLRARPAELKSALWHFPLRLLSEALNSLPAEKALTLIETEDVRLLAKRVQLTDYLADEETPLYSLRELAERTEAFIAYQESDHKYLVRTGLPSRAFRPCRWLYLRLARLYDVKATAAPWPHDDLFRSAPRRGVRPEPYKWVKTPKGPIYLGSEIRYVRYEQADLLNGMDPEDAKRIEADRARLFALKSKILHELCEAARTGNPEGLRERCYDLLIKCLSVDDAEFYLYMDRFYLGADATGGGSGDADPKMIPGGLTNILETMGHFEKEFTIGTLARTREALADWIELDRPGRFSLPEESIGPMYFSLLSRPQRQRLDAALDGFCRLEQQEHAWWVEYRTRVNDILKRHDYREVIISQRVKKDLAPKFEPYVRTFAGWVKETLEAGGQLPELCLSDAAPPGPPKRYVFKRVGDYWEVGYDSVANPVKNIKGMQYIAVLLRQANKGMHVRDLIAEVAGRPALGPSTEAYRGMSEEELARENLSVGPLGNAGPVLDAQAKQVYRCRIDELHRERADLERRGDPSRVMEINEEIQALEAHLANASALGGGDRLMGDDTDKQRKAVTNTINLALAKIKAVHVSLWQHLSATIHTGTMCSYNPPSPIPWDL